MEKLKIRPSALAGTWYPSDPAELKLSIETRLLKSAARRRVPEGSAKHGKLSGLILPHAGHRYSGQTCAAGVAATVAERGRAVSKIILIGPAHRGFVKGAVVAGTTHFETPLGRVPVDLNIAGRLVGGRCSISDEPHLQEHCLEILLPFFQTALRAFKIVPILIGSVDEEDLMILSRRLAAVIDDQTLLVASSDFVHYGRDFGYEPPVGDDVCAGVRKIDETAVGCIRKMDAAGLLEFRRRSGATICGILPIALVIETLPKKSHVEFLDYSQSADVTGDTDHMVSYAAIGFYSP